MSSTAGNLLGTIRTLDTIGGPQDLNCSAHDPEGNPHASPGWIVNHEPEHCVYGVASTTGISIIDDTDSPVWGPYPESGPGAACGNQVAPSYYWRPRRAGTCPSDTPDEHKAPCVPKANPTDEQSCAAAGCCWHSQPTTVNLYYSASRNDHLTEAACTGCDGAYSTIGPQMQVYPTPSNGANVSLWLFWSQNQTDNVVSVSPPKQPGYDNSTTHIGYIWESEFEGSVRVQLWYKPAAGTDTADHFTTAGGEQEAEAKQQGYQLVSTLGHAMAPPPSSLYSHSSHLQASVPSCFRRQGRADLYVFAHGTDYRKAVSDFAAVGGSIPLPRKHWLGWSWSTWTDPGSGSQEVPSRADWESYFKQLDAAQIGLSTLTLDCEWHVSGCWGASYTYNQTRYPDPRGMAQEWLDSGVPIGANLHDAVGVGPLEANYSSFAKAVGVDPSSNATIPANFTDLAYMRAMQTYLLDPLREQYLVSFPWTDWQQGMGPAGGVSGSNPTFLLNHARGHDEAATAESMRPLLHSRFGGLGGHRYASMFGGDVRRDMPSAKFMVYMNTVAANALVAWWGQELMQLGSDHQEVFTRLVQSSGAWGPIATFWGNNGADDRIWDMDDPFKSAVYKSLRDRIATLPYRYMLGRVAHETGLAPQRPMYYHSTASKDPVAYGEHTRYQYMLGDDLLVAPAVDFMDSESNTTAVAVWLPACQDDQKAWVDWRTGGAGNWSAFFGDSTVPHTSCTEGASFVNVSAPIDLVPVFARSDSILPLLPRELAMQTGQASQSFLDIELAVMPDAWASGSNTTIYDDDGLTNAYLTPTGYAKIMVQASTDGAKRTLQLSAASPAVAAPEPGSQLAADRSYTIRAHGVLLEPASVSICGEKLTKGQAPSAPSRSDRPDAGQWWHMEQQQVVIARSGSPTAVPCTIEVQ